MRFRPLNLIYLNLRKSRYPSRDEGFDLLVSKLSKILKVCSDVISFAKINPSTEFKTCSAADLPSGFLEMAVLTSYLFLNSLDLWVIWTLDGTPTKSHYDAKWNDSNPPRFPLFRIFFDFHIAEIFDWILVDGGRAN